MSNHLEIEKIAEEAWAAKRSGPDANLERILLLMDYAKTACSPEYEAIAQLLMALSRYYSNAFDEACEIGEKAMAQLLTHGNTQWQARGYYVMGLLASSKNKLPTSLSYWREGLSLAQTLEDQEIQGYLLYNLADMNRAIFKRYDLARDYYKKGLELCMGEKKHILCGLMLVGLSRCDFIENKLESSLKHAEEALEIALSSKDERVIGICYEFAGSRLSELEQPEKALVYLHKSLDSRTLRNDLYGIVNSHCALSTSHLKYGRLDLALEHIEKSMAYYQQLNTHVLDDLLYKQYAEVLEALSDWQGASTYYKLYAEARNTSLSKELEAQMSMMAAEFHLENAKKDAEIYKLKTEALQEKNQEISLLAAELEQALEDLKETQNELVRASRLSGLLNLIIGVAHEINTPLGNSITLASFMDNLLKDASEALNLKDDTLAPDLRQTLHHLVINLNKLSSIVESLKKFSIAPERLKPYSSDVKTYLQSFISEMSMKYPTLSIELICQTQKSFHWKFEPNSLHRVLEELISNSATHAYDKDSQNPVTISLSICEGALIISVTDFGVGMDLSPDHDLFEPFKTLKKPTSGLGLGLHLVYLLTVNVLRGEVKLSSVPHSHTNVQLKLMD